MFKCLKLLLRYLSLPFLQILLPILHLLDVFVILFDPLILQLLQLSHSQVSYKLPLLFSLFLLRFDLFYHILLVLLSELISFSLFFLHFKEFLSILLGLFFDVISDAEKFLDGKALSIKVIGDKRLSYVLIRLLILGCLVVGMN